MNEFARLQYEKIREEIMSMEQRVGRAQMATVSGTPIVLTLSQHENFGLKYMALAAPMRCWVSLTFVTYLQGSLMRCGRYIRDHLEPILADDNLIPWEAHCHSSRDDGNRIFICFISLLPKGISCILHDTTQGLQRHALHEEVKRNRRS